MQAAGHEALQEMNDALAEKANDITLGMPKMASSICGNYSKSFVRVQAIIKAYIMQHDPSRIVFTADDLPAKLVDVNDDQDEALHQVVTMLFYHAIQDEGKSALLDFVFEGGKSSTLNARIECGELMATLSIEGDLIPCITHTMHDLSELASLYDIDSDESLASVKEKVGRHLDKDDNVTYYELDHNYLECLVEREFAA